MAATVLLAAPESDDTQRLRHGLAALELSVAPVSTGAEVLERHDELRPVLVVLMLELPDIHGLDVCRRLRRTSDVPVIVMGEAPTDLDRVLALELGADDFIARPCASEEFCERVRAALKRAAETAPPSEAGDGILDFGDIVIDRRAHTLTIEGHQQQLTPMEAELLWALAERAGDVVRSRVLLEQVWGYPSGVRTRTLDVHIGRLRRKFGEDGQAPRHIIPVRGVGYRFEPSPDGLVLAG